MVGCGELPKLLEGTMVTSSQSLVLALQIQLLLTQILQLLLLGCVILDLFLKQRDKGKLNSHVNDAMVWYHWKIIRLSPSLPHARQELKAQVPRAWGSDGLFQTT